MRMNDVTIEQATNQIERATDPRQGILLWYDGRKLGNLPLFEISMGFGVCTSQRTAAMATSSHTSQLAFFDTDGNDVLQKCRHVDTLLGL